MSKDIKSIKMENNEILLDTDLVKLGGPRGKRYIMQLGPNQYLGYPKNTKINEEHFLIIVDNSEDAIVINKSNRSFTREGYYTWAFYPHGDRKKGKRIDVKFKGEFRRIFGSKHDSTSVSWKPEHENGGLFYCNIPKFPESFMPRLGHKEDKLIAAINGGYDIKLIEV